MDVSLDLYRVFYTVAESGSLTAAAEKLYLSQPAVSQKLRQLEETLGCRLFLRTSRGVRLTAEGETLRRHVGDGLDHIRLGERKLREQLSLDSGEIRVGASDMTLQFFLLPYLERFHALYPSIRISVTNGPTPETARFLAQGAIDFGVVSEEVPDGMPGGEEYAGDFTCLPVSGIQDVFIAGPRFRELAGNPLPLAELAAQPMICLKDNSSTRRYIDRFFADRGVTLTPEFELATSELIVRFAERNLGVGCVVRDFALPAIERGTVFELTPAELPPPRRLCILQSGLPVSHAAESLLKFIMA